MSTAEDKCSSAFCMSAKYYGYAQENDSFTRYISDIKKYSPCFGGRILIHRNFFDKACIAEKYLTVIKFALSRPSKKFNGQPAEAVASSSFAVSSLSGESPSS